MTSSSLKAIYFILFYSFILKHCNRILRILSFLSKFILLNAKIMPAVLKATSEFRHHNIIMYSMKKGFKLRFGNLCYVWVYQNAVSGSICWASGRHCHADNSPNMTVWNMGETDRGFPEIPLQQMSDVSVQMACGPGRSTWTHLIIYTGHSLETEKHTALTVTVGYKEILVKPTCCLALQSCQYVAFKARWCISFGFGESYNKSFYGGLILYFLCFMCSWSFWKNILYVISWEGTRSLFLIVASSNG